MKIKILVRSLVLFAPLTLLTGCVGFNTALFMTKSNAGLDLDTKPPTAEINISRKEGVVEPSFEGGKTPPVMASFSVKTDSGGMSRFFFGVNQTFAGGDAAVTMAKLYDQTNDFVKIDPSSGKETNGDELKKLFDSKQELSERPKANAKGGWRKALFGLAEPGEVRPFFFGTDSQLGVKIGWNGVGGPYPETIKVGFNRKEMAVAPVTISDDDHVRIPSFLATVDTNVKGATTGSTNSPTSKLGVSWMQYFATGTSADFLARQYGVRKAMLERADPKASQESERLKQADKNQEERIKKADALVKKVVVEVDRITALDFPPPAVVPASSVAPQPPSPKLDAALDMLTASKLFNASSFKGGAKPIVEKIDLLKKIGRDRKSLDDVNKLETFANLLITIK